MSCSAATANSPGQILRAVAIAVGDTSTPKQSNPAVAKYRVVKPCPQPASSRRAFRGKPIPLSNQTRKATFSVICCRFAVMLIVLLPVDLRSSSRYVL